MPVSQPVAFSATEGLDIGRETGTTVLPGTAAADTVFDGEIRWVELSIGADDHSHLIDPEDIMTMMMSRQ